MKATDSQVVAAQLIEIICVKERRGTALRLLLALRGCPTIFGLLSARSVQPCPYSPVSSTLKKGHVHAQHGQVGSKIPSIGWILPREPKMITEATAVTAKTPPDALAATSKAK